MEPWEYKEELEIRKYNEANTNIPMPITPSKDLVFVTLPDKPMIILELSVWEKVSIFITKWYKYIDAIITILPIILPLLTIYNWLKQLTKEKRNV